MKKIFTLIAMYFCMAVTAFAAGEVYWISFNGANEQNQEGYFSWNADKHNFNAKYTGTYNGVEYTKGLKMPKTNICCRFALPRRSFLPSNSSFLRASRLNI